MDRKQAGDILYAIREVQRGIAMSSLNCPILRHQENITEDERKEVCMVILQETLQKIWASRLCLSGQSVCLAVRTIAQKLLSILHKTGWKGVMWVKTKLFFPISSSSLFFGTGISKILFYFCQSCCGAAFSVWPWWRSTVGTLWASASFTFVKFLLHSEGRDVFCAVRDGQKKTKHGVRLQCNYIRT